MNAIEVDSELARQLLDLDNEDLCVRFLKGIRWKNKPKNCLSCRETKIYSLAKGLWECASCGKQFNVRSGTTFQGSPLELRLWFLAVFLANNPRVNSTKLSTTLHVTPKTARSMLRKINRSFDVYDELVVPIVRRTGLLLELAGTKSNSLRPIRYSKRQVLGINGKVIRDYHNPKPINSETIKRLAREVLAPIAVG